MNSEPEEGGSPWAGAVRAEGETGSPACRVALDDPAPTGGQELESEALTSRFLTGCNRTPVPSPRRVFRGSDSGSHPLSGQTFVRQEIAGSRWGWRRCGRQGAHRRAGGRRPLCLPTRGDRTADGFSFPTLPVSIWEEIPALHPQAAGLISLKVCLHQKSFLKMVT